MSSSVVRFGVAMESALLEQFDALVEQRGTTRSEVLRDLVRAELTRAHVHRGVDAVASVTLVYNTQQNDLGERLREVQTELGDRMRATLRVHLSADYAMDVLVLHGKSDDLERIADRLLAARGVRHGGIQVVTDITKHKVLRHPAPSEVPAPSEPSSTEHTAR